MPHATATADPEQLTYATPSPGTYQWKVVSYDNPNPNLAYTVTGIRCVRTALAVQPGDQRERLQLSQGFPNPFARSSVIRFALSRGGPVALRVHDITGRVVRTLVEGSVEPGFHQRVWDGCDNNGQRLKAGMYFYRLETAEGTRARRTILLR